MRGVIEDHHGVPSGSLFEVVPCNPSFSHGRGARSLFQYDETLRDPNGREWNEVVSGVAYGGRRTRKAREKLKLADGDARREPNIRRAAYLPNLDLLLGVFPFDHKLPVFESLMAGPLTGLRASIRPRYGPGDWRLDERQAEPIRYRVDLRASVKPTVRATESRSGSASDRPFLVKVYASGEEAERAWTVLHDFTAALRAAGDPFGLAPLVAYLPDDRVLVQDEVQAVSLQPITRRTDPEKAAEAVRRAARATAALHSLPVSAPAHRIELDRTDPGRLRRAAETLRKFRPDLATAVDEIETQILAGLDDIGSLPSMPVHGDMKPLHLLTDEKRVVPLDLDKFAAGELMLDVTSLLLPFRRERQTRLAGVSLVRVFIGEYFAHVPAAWEQRLGPHYAWAILAETSEFAVREGKSRNGARIIRPERLEHNVTMLVEESGTVIVGRL